MHAREHENLSSLLSHILHECNISLPNFWIVCSKEFVRNEECADSASINCKSDVIWAIPCSLLVRGEHLEEA
jgi:hypothetical protein